MNSRYNPLSRSLVMSSIVETPAAVAWPPSIFVGSRIKTLAPSRVAWIAADTPDIPPPAMIMSCANDDDDVRMRHATIIPLPIRLGMLTTANDTAKLTTAANRKLLTPESPNCLSAMMMNKQWTIYTRSLTLRSVLIDDWEYFTWTFRPIIRRKNAGVQPNIVTSL